jgi:hypothetical protein
MWLPVKSKTKLFCKNCGKTINRVNPEFWDGETYENPHFCSKESCLWEFAMAAAERYPNFSTPAHKARVKEFNKNETEAYERKLAAHARRMAKEALAR